MRVAKIEGGVGLGMRFDTGEDIMKGSTQCYTLLATGSQTIKMNMLMNPRPFPGITWACIGLEDILSAAHGQRLGQNYHAAVKSRYPIKQGKILNSDTGIE